MCQPRAKFSVRPMSPAELSGSLANVAPKLPSLVGPITLSLSK